MRSSFLAVLIAATVSTAQAAPVTVADYSGSVAPDGTFAAFDGNVVATAEGASVTLAASGDNFGGAFTSTSLLATPNLSDATDITVRAKIGATDATDTLVVATREVSGEFFSYAVSGLTTEFQDFTIPINGWFFNGDTTNATPDDTIVEVSFQSPFGSGTAFDVVVESIGFNVIPEPTSALLALLGLGAVVRRRR